MRAHERDGQAMTRRDAADRVGARICRTCDGTGAVLVVEPFDRRWACCPKCTGETWVDARGRPYKIDMEAR
jgi:DnaJ-class molecular chaperone